MTRRIHPLRRRAVIGLGIVTIGIADLEPEARYLPDSPTEPPPLMRHTAPTTWQASNSIFLYPAEGSSRPLG